MVAIHYLQTLAAAVESEYLASHPEQAAESQRARLAITFEPSQEGYYQQGEIDERLFRCKVELVEGESIPWMECQLSSIEHIDGELTPREAARLGSFAASPMMKKDDRQTPFRDHFPIDRGSERFFDLIGEEVRADGGIIRRTGQWYLRFAVDGRDHPAIPPGTYRLSVKASGFYAKPDKKILEAHQDDDGRLAVRLLEEG